MVSNASRFCFLLIDRTENFDVPYVSDNEGCEDLQSDANCLSYVEEEFCRRLYHDHNYFAVCRLLFDPADHFGLRKNLEQFPSFSTYRDNCYNSNASQHRQYAAQQLIAILSTVINQWGPYFIFSVKGMLILLPYLFNYCLVFYITFYFYTFSLNWFQLQIERNLPEMLNWIILDDLNWFKPIIWNESVPFTWMCSQLFTVILHKWMEIIFSSLNYFLPRVYCGVFFHADDSMNVQNEMWIHAYSYHCWTCGES